MTGHQESKPDRGVQRSIAALASAARESYCWLLDFVPDLFASTLREDEALLARLAAALPRSKGPRSTASPSEAR